MAGRYFLGVDGGQTSTLALLCDETGALLGVGRAGPSNHVGEPGGPARLEAALSGSIHGAFAAAGLEPAAVEAACLGMTGGGEKVATVLPAIVPIAKLQIEHDSVTAQAGALAGGPGVIVIAGTGSVAFGVNSAGQRARAGGWAYIMGDEGSGYDLGRQALIAAARASDGRGPATRLLADVLQRLGKATLWDVRTAVYGGEIDRAAIAQLSRVVVEASQAGDAVADAILDRGCHELAEIAAAVLRQLGMDEQEAPVAPVGGLFRAGDAIMGPFVRHLAELAPCARVRPPIYPPALGAVLLALRLAGIAFDDAVRQRFDVACQILRQEK